MTYKDPSKIKLKHGEFKVKAFYDFFAEGPNRLDMDIYDFTPSKDDLLIEVDYCTKTYFFLESLRLKKDGCLEADSIAVISTIECDETNTDYWNVKDLAIDDLPNNVYEFACAIKEETACFGENEPSEVNKVKFEHIRDQLNKDSRFDGVH